MSGSCRRGVSRPLGATEVGTPLRSDTPVGHWPPLVGDLERYLESPLERGRRALWGGLRRARATARAVQRWTRTGPKGDAASEPPKDVREWLFYAAAAEMADPEAQFSPTTVAAGFCELVGRGGSVTARRVLSSVERQLPALPAKLARRVAARIIDIHRAWGDDQELEAFTRRHETLLRDARRHPGSFSGQGLMARDGDEGADGFMSPQQASQMLTLGELSPEAVCRALLQQRERVARDPELELLLASAYALGYPDWVGAPLNRYLVAQGTPRLRVLDGDGLLLARLAPPLSLARRGGPRVSVIIAARDAASTIRYSVDSILDQSYRDIEVLVCDDSSSDDTLSVLLRAYGHHPRVRLFASERNQGSYNVRNALCEAASGSYVTFHDADDYALPTRIAAQVAVLGRHGTVGVVGSGLRVRNDSTFVFYCRPGPLRLSMVSLMLRRSLVRELGPFRSARFGADKEFYERLRSRFPGRVARIHQPLILSLWSSSSLTRGRGSESLETGFRSEARHAYSELSFRRWLFGEEQVPDTAIEASLLEHGNYLEPAPVRELTSQR